MAAAKKSAVGADGRKKDNAEKQPGAKFSIWWVPLFFVLLVLLGGVIFLIIQIPGKLTKGNPRFKLQLVSVQSAGYWNNRGEELLNRLEIPRDSNLFQLDVGKIRKDLLANVKNVAEAEVQLVLPDMIVFKINERIPRAEIAGSQIVLDENAVMFKRSESIAADNRKLPQIIMGRGGNRGLQKDAVELIMTANRECRDIVIDRIILNNPFDMTVYLSHCNDRLLMVRFPIGKESYSILFNKLRNAILHCALNRENPSGFDLRFKEYAVPF